MLRVECQSCKAPYQVDERRVPPNGLKMRCPKCGFAFVVKADGTTEASPAAAPQPAPVAAPQPVPAAPKPPPVPPRAPRAPTMVGLGIEDADLPAMRADLPAMRADLPAAARKPPVPRAAPPVPAAKPALKEDDPFGKISIPSMPAVPQPAAAHASLPPALGSLDAPPAKGGARPVAPAPFGSIDPGLDLPAPVADLPATAQRAELPAVARGAALPAVAQQPRSMKKTSVGIGGIDVDVRPGPAAAPKTRRDSMELDLGTGGSKPELGFGELDLPALSNELPSVANQLPAVGGGALPAVSASLPSVASSLPSPAASLPSPANALPSPANALPSPANALPSPANALPAPANALPAPANVLPQSLPPGLGLGDFGELDLGGHDVPGAIGAPPMHGGAAAPSAPPYGAAPSAPPYAPSAPPYGAAPSAPPYGAAPSAPPYGAAPNAFGEVDIGGALPPPEPAPHSLERGETKAAGGMAFGEVDLGGGGGGGGGPVDLGEALDGLGEAPLPQQPAAGPPPAVGGGLDLPGAEAGVEASLPTGGKSRERREGKKASRAPRVLLLVLGLAIVAGGALQLTPYGAFGYLAISDSVKAKDYARAATDAGTKTRQKLASDTYSDARAVLDDLAVQRQKSPRARGLVAYTVGTYFAYEVRFGRDVDKDGRAKQWFAELKDTDARYLVYAQAALDAANGDWTKARKGLDNAAKRDAGDGIQQDIALLRGEVELAAKDPAAAVTAFKAALAAAPTARAHYGLARAAMLGADVPTARKEVAETLAASPKHAGALLLRADLEWNVDGDEKAAIKDLAAVLDAKDAASPAEQTLALSRRGWIHAARGRAGEARADFEAALKLDARSVAALVGQGEVFYGEGRFTEALSRFDTAVQTDKTDVLAIVSDAKAKLALERLQDAKTQLSEARVTYPKDWRVAYWLGKTEEALGNRAAAEHQYTSAIELAPITDREAILPYVALATTYLSAGKGKDAQAKLDEAKSKLPDSASLQRAFGELAAVQGEYDDAVKYFEAAIAKDPQDVSTRFRLGATFRRMGQVDKAGEQFDLVLASDKDYPGLALERGLLYEQSGDVEKALEQFKNALAKAPDDPDLMLRVGASYVAIERPDEAIPMLKKVLEKRTNSAEANHYLGRALFLKGATQEVEAMRYLKRAVELDPHRAEYHLYLGWAANNASPAQLGVARDEIDKALQQDKLLADAYWQRGVLLRKESAVDDAIKDLKHALELKPSRVEIYAAMGECYEDKNDLGAALGAWQKAIAGNDKVAYWRYRYGRLLLEKHAYADAAKHLAFAADAGAKEDQKPGWYTTSEFLAAEALRGSGKKAEAKERYRKFLQTAPMSSPDRRDAIRALRELGEEWAP